MNKRPLTHRPGTSSGKIKKFVIKRARWLRGKRTKDGCALRVRVGGTYSSKFQMCCLGFYLEACGARRKDLLERGMPEDWLRGLDAAGVGGAMDAVEKKGAEWLFSNKSILGSNAAKRLAVVNDDEDISEEEREKRVKAHFAAQGVKVIFE